MKVVFTNGVFDILHRGHIDLLRFCKEHGDHLVVAIDSDRRVRETKGPSRPVNSQDDRKIMLRSIRYVDEVVVFDSIEELQALHACIHPDVVVKGADWASVDILKTDGIRQESTLLFYPILPGYSTTSAIQKIRGVS